MKEHIHLQVMPNYNYLLLFLLCFIIYPSTVSTASGRACDNSTHICIPHSPPHSSTSGNRSIVIVDNSTLPQGKSISFGGSLISGNKTFKLGFFVGGGNTTYLGIWYTNSPEAIVWVANRDNPIPSQRQGNCSLVVVGGGIAKLLDSDNNSYWSTSSSSNGINFLQLIDSGNLILYEQGSRQALWQSFMHPTNTILEDQVTYFNTSFNLTSWEGGNNPAQGDYSFQIAISTDYSLSISRISSPSIPYWVVSRRVSDDQPTALTSFLNGTLIKDNKTSVRLVLNPDGSIQLLQQQLHHRAQNSTLWKAPRDQCDLYEGSCGSIGVCDADNSFKCKCLPGFKPIGESNGFTGDCDKITSDRCGNEFLRLPMVNMPPDSATSNAGSQDICKESCLSVPNCVCKAYSYDPRHSNCLLWTQYPTKIQQEFYNPSNGTLYIRVAQSDIDYGKSACNICGTNVIPYPLSTNSTCGNPNYFNFQCNSSNGQVYFRPSLGGDLYKVSHIDETCMKFVIQLSQNGGTSKCDTTDNIESKLLGLSNSSPYKVTNCSVVQLIDRRPVEVELSWNPPPPPLCNTLSDCGYWPNTTCDAKVCKCAKGFHSDLQFLNCTIKDHKGKLFWVEVGVASIVLLLGTIFVILQLRKKRAKRRHGITEIKTTDNDIEDIDIVSGYMSPEYALDGYFSIKSDVYSFGIVVLEVISGKRCGSLLHIENSLITLLGYAWFRWDQGNPLELVDESVGSYDASEVKRCINVGLLCVQEDPSDRPTMSTVLSMLTGDTMNLPYPKQPIFVPRRPPSESTSSSNKSRMCGSNVELTMTIEGR